ncbi:carboxypeptidase-like regulatory domain-containing protein, partial [Pelotomaculum propionicicum]|uniref:carboxypeptidase-like regulatory domain-containing protein n=1 Tax=Pelotomaculum propionicicum TaxID=258475 RepID=UPI0010646A43
ATGSSNPVYQFWFQAPNGNWYSSGPYGSGNTFQLPNPVAGTYTVVAYAKDANSSQAVVASNTVEFTFTGGSGGGAGITGTVTIRGTGGPAYVSLRDGVWQTVNNGGTFTFSNLTPGSYLLAIFADKYPAKVTPVTVTSGQTTTVNVTLVPGDTDGNGLIN